MMDFQVWKKMKSLTHGDLILVDLVTPPMQQLLFGGVPVAEALKVKIY